MSTQSPPNRLRSNIKLCGGEYLIHLNTALKSLTYAEEKINEKAMSLQSPIPHWLGGEALVSAPLLLTSSKCCRLYAFNMARWIIEMNCPRRWSGLEEDVNQLMDIFCFITPRAQPNEKYFFISSKGPKLKL